MDAHVIVRRREITLTDAWEGKVPITYDARGEPVLEWAPFAGELAVGRYEINVEVHHPNGYITAHNADLEINDT